MTSSNGNNFSVTDPLCWEFTDHRWIPRTKASDAELWCFLWPAPWINAWVNNRKAGDLRRHRSHHDATVMTYILRSSYSNYHEHIEAQNMAAAWQTAGISYFDSNFMEICSQSSNKQKSNTGSDNGLAAKRWGAIIWINDGLTYRRIFALLGLEGLMSTYKDTPNTGFNQSSFIHFINM